MKTHPIIDHPCRWIPMLILAVIFVIIQVFITCGYTEADYLPAFIDGVATIGWFMAVGYLAWFVAGFVSLFQTEVIIMITGVVIWLGGSFIVYDIMTRIMGLEYISFVPTIPFRLLFGIPGLIAILIWYRLIVAKQATEYKEQEVDNMLPHFKEMSSAPEPQVEVLDRITVKDGSRIHLIKVEELLYIQACGDYVTLVTLSGEYIKEQTMKFFESCLPLTTFVRVHRSTIVNVTQISRVELFGKETYQLLLKNGVKLRVSLSGYKLLKERLGI